MKIVSNTNFFGKKNLIGEFFRFHCTRKKEHQIYCNVTVSYQNKAQNDDRFEVLTDVEIKCNKTCENLQNKSLINITFHIYQTDPLNCLCCD